MRATVGQMVLYYQNGVRSNQPRPAVVMQAADSNSTLGLNVFPEQGGTMFFKRCVYHINDPHIVKNPAVAMSYGTWEHMACAPAETYDSLPLPPIQAAPAPAPIPEPPVPETGDAQADLMHKLLATAGGK